MPKHAIAALSYRLRTVRTRAGYAALLVLGLLTACSPAPEPVSSQQFLAFGTLVEVTLYGVEESQAQPAFSELEALFERLHHDWHAWQPGPLTELNRGLAEQGNAQVPEVLQPLLEPAQRLSLASGELFNPAIGGLLQLWGFQSDEPPSRPPPADAIAAQLAAKPSMRDLHLQGTRLHTTNRAVQLDFGAFAKGVAIDQAIERLRARGIHNALVNAGGDLRAIGRHGNRAWRIGVRHPRGPGMLALIEVEGDESIFTSGDYERGFVFEGRHYHHILDPRSGYPANQASSVTVIAQDAGTADAAATALLVAGPAEWVKVAHDLQLRDVMLVDTQGVVHLTPSMAQRVQFEQQPEVRLSEVP